MTSRPFLDGPLSAGARRCQRRSCSLRCACSTLTPPTHWHGQHGSSNGHPRLECRPRGHPVCPSTAPAINGAPRGRSSTLLPCRGAVPGKVTPRRSPGRHLGDDGLEPEDPELGYFATSPQAGVFASSQFWRAAASQQVGPDRTATVKRVQTPTLSGALSARFRVSVLFSAPRARSAALLARMCMTSAG